MEMINLLIDNYNIPILTAFLLGILSSISPCTLATNIGAVAYISKDFKSASKIVLNGLIYTIGRGLSYALLGILVYLGVSLFSISNIFQAWASLLLGPIFIILALIMFGVFKLRFNISGGKIEVFKQYLSRQGYLGTLLLGMILALAFCPYSGVLFFAALMPLALQSSGGFFLFFMFALGTGLPVIIFSFIIAFSVRRVGQVFNVLQKIEKSGRIIVALIFLLVGLYYLQFLIKYLYNLI
ncbi:MAG: sulfite exporter TauE/SafE family protein [Clostridia bacterium]|nr:sulfite exporter TauE/SafE family protein [Clostridia bacterium]